MLDKPDRTAAEDDEMLASAFASRLHWSRVGTVKEWTFGDEHIARVACVLGMGDLAVKYAKQALVTTQSSAELPDFALAAAHETMARAAACAGDRETRNKHVELGRQALELIADAEDRVEIESQLNSVP